jgi:hypothetical protein
MSQSAVQQWFKALSVLEMKCLKCCFPKCVYPRQNIGIFIFQNLPVEEPPSSSHLNGAPPPPNFQSKKCKKLTAALKVGFIF